MALSRFKFTKESLGRILVPRKIGTFELKSNLQKTYEKIYFDNINPLTITNVFFTTQIILFISFIYFYERIYITFADLLDSSLLIKFFIISGIYVIGSFIIFLIAILLYYAWLEGKVKKLETEIEKDLPEFIDSLVSNIKGGISLEKALLKSVRTEQKALLREVTLINEKIMMGKSALEGIEEFRKRYNSEVLGRTLFLLEEGMKSGGNLAQPLERISENLKRIYILNEEIKGNASGFTIIIRAISIVIAPLLFALALTLLTFISNLFTLLEDTDADIIGNIGGIPVEFSLYLMTFSYAMIILITLFSSLITSQLKNEKLFVSIKYLPIYIGISILFYNIFTSLLLDAFGAIIT